MLSTFGQNIVGNIYFLVMYYNPSKSVVTFPEQILKRSGPHQDARTLAAPTAFYFSLFKLVETVETMPRQEGLVSQLINHDKQECRDFSLVTIPSHHWTTPLCASLPMASITFQALDCWTE